MTTYSGLTFIAHFLRLYKIHSRIKETFKRFDFKGDILFILLIMILIGSERLQHLEYLESDPLFCGIVRLTRIPYRTKVSTALKILHQFLLKPL